MGRIKIYAIFLIVMLWPFMASAQDGHPYAAYKLFDQTENKGWRGLANEERYLEAAEGIDQFLVNNDNLLKWQLRNLYFHAGQMFALAGEYTVAVARFNHSIYDDQPVDYPILWNAYVRASIAFLENDKDKLIEMRDKIKTGPTFQGVTRNLDVVNRLLENYDKSYADAFLVK